MSESSFYRLTTLCTYGHNIKNHFKDKLSKLTTKLFIM